MQNMQQRRPLGQRESWCKDCKKGPDGKVVITRGDRDRVRKLHLAGVNDVDVQGNGEAGWEDVDAYGMSLYMPLCTDMIEVAEDAQVHSC